MAIAVCQFDAVRAFIAMAAEYGVFWWDPATGVEPRAEQDVETLWGVAAAGSA